MTESRRINKALMIGMTVAVIVIGGGVAACSDSESSTEEAGNESSIAASSDTRAEESTTPAEAASLPDGYPEDAAPIYQPSTITIGMNMGEDWMVTIESDDDIEDIAGGNAGYGIIITYNTVTEKNVSSVAYHIKPQIER